MSEKAQLSKLQQISNDELTALQTLNDNFKKIENQFDNVLSRTNESPNNMESDLDMDQHSIINVKSGKGPNDVVVRKDIQDLVDKAEDIIQAADKVLGRVDEKTQLVAGFAKDAADSAGQAKVYRDDSERFAREASFEADRAQEAADRAEQGGGQADLTDYVRKIDDTLEAEITSSGTYNGLEVTSGEVFVHENGRLYQYTKQEVSSGGAQGFVWESLSQNSPANSSFSVTACEDDRGTIIIPNAQSTYVTISNDFGHNWRSEFLSNFKFTGHSSNTSVPTYSSATVFNGAQFVYFGSQGPAHSADGLNWTSSSYANSMVLESVTGAAFINGTYVVSDASGQVYYSTDNGVTLTPTSITDGRVTMAAGFALCVRGNSETGEALSISHDGINWITRSPSVSFPEPEIQAVTNGNTIVLVGPCSTEVSAVYVSPDGGLSWTSMPLPLSCKPRLVYTGGKFIILQNEVQSDTILWSYDGYTWNTEQLMVQGSWRTVVSSYILGTWTFFSDLDTIVASEWNTDSSSGTVDIIHNLMPLSLTNGDVHMLLEQTGLEASKVDILTQDNLEAVLLRDAGTLYVAAEQFDYEPIGQTGLYSQIYRGHIYKLQSDDNGLMHLIDITPEPEIEQQDLTPYVRHLDTEHAEQIVLDGTYDGQDVEDGEVFVQHGGKLVEFDKTLNPGGDWGTSSLTGQEYVETRGLYGNGVVCIPAGIYNTVNVSSDRGRTWTNHTGMPFSVGNPSPGQNKGCFNGQQFVVLYDKFLCTSTDGVSWTLRQTNLDSSAGLAFGNGRYVTKSSDVIKYSDDGLNWLAIQDSTSFSGYSLQPFANGKFIAVGSSSVAISEDGENWSIHSKPSGNGRQCAGGNGIFVISDVENWSYGTSNTFFYSTDGGITWNTSHTASSRNWVGLSWCGDRFFAVSHKDNLYTYSFDGKNWIEGTMPQWDYWTTVTYVNGDIIVTCGQGTNKPSVAYVSFTPFYEYGLTDLSFNKAEAESTFALKSDIPTDTKLSISTEEQALAGVDDTTAMSPLKTFSVIADNVGRGVQLGFNGTLSEGVLTFEVPSENAGEYTLKHLYNYEIDLLFEAVGQLDDSTQIVIKNGAQNINIVNAKHDDYKTPVTIGDMKQIMKYSTDIGFRWIFDARYTVTTDGQPVFVMPSTVTNSPTTQDGVTVFEGDNHPVVIKGQAGTTATGLQVQDSLEAGSAVDFEHYRSGDQYGIQFTVDNSKATTGGTQYWRSYVTDGGVSVTDFTTQNSVLVPTPSDTDVSARAVNTSWFNGNAMRKPSEGVPTGLKTFGYSDDAKELYYRGGSLTRPYTLQLDHKGAFPSSDYTDIEVTASGATFTAPCVGFFAMRGSTTAAGGRIELHNVTGGDLTIKSVEPNTNRVVAAYLPCNTGDTLRAYYADVDINLFRLVKAKGETL